MLYLVKVTLDRHAFAACEYAAAMAAAEAERANVIKGEGRLIGVWRRADCGGSVFIVDTPSHESLAADLQSMPMFRYWASAEVTPIIAHPAHPEFGSARLVARPTA